MLLDPSLRLPVRCLFACAGPAKENRTLRWLVSRNFLSMRFWMISEPKARTSKLFATPVWGFAYRNVVQNHLFARCLSPSDTTRRRFRDGARRFRAS